MSSPKSSHITWHQGHVTRERRAELLGHGSAVVWLTGLSGSGKSTIARYVEHLLIERGVHAYVLDGDNIRFGLNRDLAFSPADRTENIRRIGEVSKLMVDAGMIVLTAFISPYREDRDAVRRLQTVPQDFFEVFVDAPLEVCEGRDTKGLYKRARAGEIPEFTGISAPYEAPVAPELVLPTATHSLEECGESVVELLRQHRLVRD